MPKAVTKTKTTKATKTTKKTASVKPADKPTGLTFPVMGVDGAKVGTITLSKELFGVNVNKQLMAQAVRVYRANQRAGGAMTKTRGNVEGSTRKIYRQKGTGKARHGSIRAPIFVGGGVVFGPQTHDFSLKMPEKMRKVALASALTTQRSEGKITVIDGLEGVGKTKGIASALSASGIAGSTLFVIPTDGRDTMRAARNIGTVDVVLAPTLTTYDVLTHAHIVFTKKAVQGLKT